MKLLLLSIFSLSMCIGKAQSKTNQPERDTVKVIALYCDTAYVPLLNAPNSPIKYKNTNMFWKEMYEVRQWQMVHVCYLDEEKKPLKKSIMVWISKPL